MTDAYNTERALTVKELIEILQHCDPEAEIISTIWNGWAHTYCAIDSVSHFTYDELSNDFFGTPGRTDKKVFFSHAKNIVALTSSFEFDSELVHDVHENLKDGLDYWHEKQE